MHIKPNEMLVFNFDLTISRPKKIEFLLKQSSTWHRSVYDWPFPVCVEQACQRLTFSGVQAKIHSSVWNMARCVSLCSIWLFQAGTHRKGIHLLLLHLFRYDRHRQLTTQFRMEYICLCYTLFHFDRRRQLTTQFRKEYICLCYTLFYFDRRRQLTTQFRQEYICLCYTLFHFDRRRQLTTQFCKEYICLCYTFFPGMTAAGS